ncbi:uncharacterized protein LOC111705957, partial [Eurytemora carolleeae]|uniref:uncharacterized protein LOC111705957 n=1 Tax=Eurytemora carolleeae TaxID=1294199 RepID=UPI000C78BDF0
MIGYNEVDLGVPSLGITPEINKFVDPSFYYPVALPSWTTKSPGKWPPAYNILKVFDIYAWSAILVSLVCATIVLLFLSNVIKSLGFNQPDNVLIALLPLSLLNAEGMPDWFLFNRNRVYSGSILILTWALASTLLTFAFASNIRAILLAQSTEIPVETSAEIVERNMYPILVESGKSFWYNYFITSPNPYHVKLMEDVVIVESEIDAVKQIYEDKSAVFLGERGYVENTLIMNSDFLKTIQDKGQPFHYCKEKLGYSHSYGLVQKDSIWAEHINYHFLISEQASFWVVIGRLYPSIIFEEPALYLEKLNFEHMAVAYILLGSGLGIS